MNASYCRERINECCPTPRPFAGSFSLSVLPGNRCREREGFQNAGSVGAALAIALVQIVHTRARIPDRAGLRNALGDVWVPNIRFRLEGSWFGEAVRVEA